MPRRRGFCVALLVAALAGVAAAPAQESSSPDDATPEPQSLPQLEENVTITAERQPRPLEETAAAISIVEAERLSAQPSIPLDELLRATPGFSLFRRTDSRTANPTTQGVALRGLGGNAASRALVLLDGVPINDPFGGWVAWGRLHPLTLARVEVLRGAASHLYGSPALGGVVHAIADDRSPARASGEALVGERGLRDATVIARWQPERSPWRLRGVVNALHSEGWVPVTGDARGPVDARADIDQRLLEFRALRSLGCIEPSAAASCGEGFFALQYFDEERGNGTKLQRNSSRSLNGWGGIDLALSVRTSWRARLFASTQRFEQSFSAVSLDRTTESLTRLQVVPAQQLGFSSQWEIDLTAEHELVLGFDGRQLRGESRERRVIEGRPQVERASGAAQWLSGAFLQHAWRASRGTRLVAGLRIDDWRQRDPHVAGREVAARRAQRLSPHLALTQRLAELTVYASAYEGFRAPTLNELYRGFRVGDVVTEPNPDLAAERVRGGEVGLRGRGWSAALFHLELEDAISNVTVAQSATLTTRQRANLARVRSRGAEAEYAFRFRSRGELAFAYQFAEVRVRRAPREPSLEGLRVAQVPKQGGSVRWSQGWGDSVTSQVSLRAASVAFDDDLNRQRLPAFATADASLRWRLHHRFSLGIGVDNALDERVTTARTPVESEARGRAWWVAATF